MAVVFEQLTAPRALFRAGPLVVRLAGSPERIEAAQRLRHRVFAGELGARLGPGVDGVDRDLFDAHCSHLIVEDESTDEVVGTYRVMLPEQALRAGCLYIDGEFFMDRLRPIRGRLVEIGRSCVHPDYRSGGVIMLLWAGLGELLGRMRHRYVIGCASVSIADGGHFAASLHRQLAAAHGASEEFRVFPKDRLPVEALGHGCAVVVPPLVKAYLRAGGQVIGEPHRDRDFNCADIPMLLAIERLEGRYARRFVRGC